MDERNHKAMNEELNQPSCLGDVSGSVIDDRCKSVLKYLIPDYETAMSAKQYNNAMEALKSIYYGVPSDKHYR